MAKVRAPRQLLYSHTGRKVANGNLTDILMKINQRFSAIGLKLKSTDFAIVSLDLDSHAP